MGGVVPLPQSRAYQEELTMRPQSISEIHSADTEDEGAVSLTDCDAHLVKI